MWVFRRAGLAHVRPTNAGMAFSEEIKIEALQAPDVRFGEVSIEYSERIGETKLYTWRDGWLNLWFLFRRRARRARPVVPGVERQSAVINDKK
jgi:hypothetical protein